MEIERKGGTCFTLSVKKSVFVVDPKLSTYGIKDYNVAGVAAVLLTQPEFSSDMPTEAVCINGPGEYEVNNCSVKGIAMRPYSKPDDAPKTATMYRLEADNYNIAILGHSKASLSEKELEDLGMVDIVVLPVGGYGYTLDPKEAVKLVREIGPKVVIPLHYQEDGIKFEVPQAPLDEFIKELGAEHEVTSKLKLKPGLFPESLTVYELTRTK